MKIIKKKHTEKNHYHSLVVKTVISLLLLILPLNTLSLMTANSMIRDAQEILQNSAVLPLNSHMNIIDNKITNSNYFLYNLPSSNADCIAMLAQENDWTYTYHRTLVFQTVYDSLSMTNSADHLFFYMKEKNDILNIANNSSEKYQTNTCMAYWLLKNCLTPNGICLIMKGSATCSVR
ncbi:MAG TPA: hypothetical protein PLU43_01000 [Lachnospiraceae bacterium]|nr:hypothetical protein [Lachnospiraceae bacterium]